MSSGQLLRLAARAMVIFLLFAWAFVRWLAGWALLILTLRRRQARKDWFGACLVGLFRSLGATFIKVGQIMSTRPDLLPPHVIAALETLQDNVGPFPYALVQRTLLEDLRRPPEEVFAEIAPAPIASASVEQVHKAKLLDGRVVAVKVRRPKIDQVGDFDL